MSAVSVRLVKVGVHMGDHAQDVVTTVEVRREETVVDAALRLMGGNRWASPNYEWRLEVQLVEPAPPDPQPELPTGISDFEEAPLQGSEPF